MKTFWQFSAAVRRVSRHQLSEASIDISHGTWPTGWFPVLASWCPIAATSVLPKNGTWAPPPSVSGFESWVSFMPIQSTSCVVGQTPGNGCANPLVNAGSDNWTYALNVSAATLGVTSGDLNFIFGADDQPLLAVGNGGPVSPGIPGERV